LLDTHALLWWLDDNPRLGQQARRAIADPDNEVWISAVCVWEITIKQALGKLTMGGDLGQVIDDNRFGNLPITAKHALAVGSLPPIHRDPFDRLLVAQTGLEKLVLVTGDTNIGQYQVSILWN